MKVSTKAFVLMISILIVTQVVLSSVDAFKTDKKFLQKFKNKLLEIKRKLTPTRITNSGYPFVEITSPVPGYVYVLGRAIAPCNKNYAIIVGKTVDIRGYAYNVENLTCWIVDSRYYQHIVYKNYISDFGSGRFHFRWSNASRGIYGIIVKGYSGSKSSMDFVEVIVFI